jgi:hypothetical protein
MRWRLARGAQDTTGRSDDLHCDLHRHSSKCFGQPWGRPPPIGLSLSPPARLTGVVVVSELQMRRRAVLATHEYPTVDLLRDLIAEVEDARSNDALPPVLGLAPVQEYPSPLGRCTELHVNEIRTTFVLSQARSGGKGYITVSGKRNPCAGKGVKSQRSTDVWPRTRKTNRLRPVSLHRWICVATRGPPPSEDSDATHVCGNERCIAAAHLRWQSQGENRDDQRFHKMHAPLTPRSQTTSMRRFSRMTWPE